MRSHHTDLAAQDARVLVLMRSPAASRRGKTVLGTAAKASPKECALLGEDVQFIITLSQDDWNVMPERTRRALLDHELMHCRAEVDEDGETKWTLAAHDIEEFTDILERHGAWNDGIRDVVATLQQLDLFKTPEPGERSSRSGPRRARGVRRGVSRERPARTHEELMATTHGELSPGPLRLPVSRLQVGDGLFLNGVAFRITDISPRGLVLKPMSGRLEHSVEHGWQVVKEA